MSKNKELPDIISIQVEVQVRFNIDLSSKEASEKMETKVFNNAVKEDIDLFSQKKVLTKKST